MHDQTDWTIYERIPFFEKGRSFHGCDCWGLVRLIYKQELATILPNYIDAYEDTINTHHLAQLIQEEKQTVWREVRKPKTFDLIVINMMGFPSHVGVITEPGFMIHCTNGVGVSHEKYNTLRWAQKIAGFYRYDKSIAC